MSKNNKFIERSIMGALSFLKLSVLAEEYSCRKGLLQSLDPRVKVLTFLSFIFQAILIRNVSLLLCLYALCLILAFISGINLWFFLKRTWIFIPLFSLFIAIPALFSVITPGEALAVFDIIGYKLIITRQGLSVAVIFVLRVVTCVSFAVLLSVTTKHFVLLKVLRIFKIPQVFVMTMGMCQRYIYLFVEIIENTFLAIKSRVGVQINYKRGQRIVAWNIGSLWKRSYRVNQDVYNAMLSRGFSGEPVIMNDFRAKIRDWVFLFLSGVFSAVMFYFNYRIRA